MKASSTLLCVCLTFMNASVHRQTDSAQQPHDPPSHPVEYWRKIAQSHYAVPQDQSVFSLARELSGYLGSPDPVLRDDLAYSILDVWIVYRNELSEHELLALADEWEANLRIGIGETGNDRILRRSFSALCLAALAERDLKSPFLGEDRYRRLLSDALAYLKDERDLRGFDPAKGWIHSTAHAADLLSFLATNTRLKVEDQARILQAVSERLSSAHEVYSYGEQDRLAFTVTSLVVRKDSDALAFNRWLTKLNEADRNVWKNSPPNDDSLKTYQNNSYLLEALAARLYAQPTTPEITRALNLVTEVLRKR